MLESSMEEGHPIGDRPYMKARRDRYADLPKLYEFELHLLNDHPINENEDASWEIIKGAYYNILFDDPHWHFFWEDKYNIIRCSYEFYDELEEYLIECGVTYIERGKWEVDGSRTVNRYKLIYTALFHQFSMMALEEYNCIETAEIFDRVAHCFLNHQYFTLKNYREGLPVPELWEPKIIGENSMYRSKYIGYCIGVNKVVEYYKKKDKEEAKPQEIEKLGCFKKFIKRVFKL